MDISETIVANSEQINADDLLGRSVTATITSVEKGTAEQPVFIHLDTFPGRTYRPAKSMRRILIAAWGTESAAYIGRQITLYNDPTVRWAGQAVGGVRISGLSHIDKPLNVALTVSRGKRSPYIVQPIVAPKETSGRDWLKELDAAGNDLDALFKLGTEARTAGAPDTVIAKILAKYKSVEAGG